MWNGNPNLTWKTTEPKAKNHMLGPLFLIVGRRTHIVPSADIAHYVELFKHLPKFNNKKESPKYSKSAAKHRDSILALLLNAIYAPYGLQRIPVTLYAQQWERLLDFSDQIRKFMEENDSQLDRKN